MTNWEQMYAFKCVSGWITSITYGWVSVWVKKKHSKSFADWGVTQREKLKSFHVNWGCWRTSREVSHLHTSTDAQQSPTLGERISSGRNIKANIQMKFLRIGIGSVHECPASFVVSAPVRPPRSLTTTSLTHKTFPLTNLQSFNHFLSFN